MNGPAPTCRWTKTRRFLVRSCRLLTVPSWGSLRSGASTIITNGARPERPSRRAAATTNASRRARCEGHGPLRHPHPVASFNTGTDDPPRHRLPTGKTIDGLHGAHAFRSRHLLISADRLSGRHNYHEE